MAQPQDNLSTLLLAAGNIESRMFGLCYPEQLVVAFHNRPQYLGSAWHGLLALSLDGEVLAANQQACELLQIGREALLGRRSSDLLGIRIDQPVDQFVDAHLVAIKAVTAVFAVGTEAGAGGHEGVFFLQSGAWDMVGTERPPQPCTTLWISGG